tara:strand:- start:26 stop:277 length:252 start_codon:yes stop_codon:yes gene_type:complete
MNFFRKYKVDIEELLSELNNKDKDRKITPPEDFVSRVMKSLDETSRNSRNILIRVLAFFLLVFLSVLVFIIARNRSKDKSEDE